MVFHDRFHTFTQELRLTSANSINLARILAQVLYYFEISAALRARLPGAFGASLAVRVGRVVLALLAVVLMPLYPEQRSALRLFHLHANLLGFVGLTALGTLQVLLPTCMGRPDPDAALRLRCDLKWAVGGVLLISLGAAAMPQTRAALITLGTMLYGWVVLKVLRDWLQRFGIRLIQMHGAAPSLAAAALGLFVLLVLGLGHGSGWLQGRPSVAGYVIAFLLPLVSGAAAHLMPVWLRPGPQGTWHQALRSNLCRWGGLRGLALLLLGIAITLAS